VPEGDHYDAAKQRELASQESKSSVNSIKSGSTYEERLKQTPTNGHWSGDRGESTFHHKDPEINGLTDGNGITYTDAYPDFHDVSSGTVKIDMTTSRDKNFRRADKAFADQKGVAAREIREWRRDNNYTWHEVEDLETMELIHTDVNGKFGHMGGIGELERGKLKPQQRGTN